MRRTALVSILCSVICLAYFYMLDRVLFSSAHFAPIFHLLLTVYDMQTAWLAAGVCALAALWTRSAAILRFVEFLTRHPLGISLAGTVIIVLGSILVYRNCPFSMDEYAAVFQSRVFAAGHLSAQFQPGAVDWLIVPGFNGSFLMASHETGRAIEGYWPGFALLLAAFALVDMPWLCNAVLGGISIYLIYRITIEISGDQRAGGWAILFTLASGAFLANAISLYSMQAHLTFNLLFAWLLIRPTRARAIAAGMVGSFALVLHNPFPHAVFALPWVFAFAVRRDLRRHFVPLILGYLPLTVALGLGWLMFRSSIVPESHAAQVSSLAVGVFNWPDARILNMRVAAVAKLWVWAVPGLFVFATMGYMRHRGNLHVSLLAQSAALTFAGYLFVNFDQGHGWGYRYFQSAWGAVPILAACAMAAQPEDQRLASFAGAASILSLLLIVPFQTHQIGHIISRHLSQLPAPRRPGNNVFLVNPSGGFYVADMIQVDPSLRTPDLLLVSHGSRRDAEFMRHNWPDATEIASGPWGQQWYLAPTGKRRSGTPDRDGGGWVFNSDSSNRP